MKQEIQFNKVTWIDIADPNDDDILFLQENFNIHPLAIEEFVTPTFRPKATQYNSCLFLTVHIPLYDTKKRTTYAGEVDIVLTKTHLITGHRQEIYQLKTLFDGLKQSEGKKRLHMNETPAHLLYSILEILIESCFPRLDHISQRIDEIEDEVFNGHEKAMVKEISFVKRDILNFRRTLMPQRSILESLAVNHHEYIEQKLHPYFQDLVGTNIRLWNTLSSAKETIESLEDTNESLLSDKINEKMRIITIFSVILLPSTLYANVLGINVHVPLQEQPDGFWLHIGMMVIIGILTVVIFKLKKWI